jgi:RNA polymerase sigma factor (sigma-70 family)
MESAAMKVRAWEPWEYRVLGEGHDPEKTARLLKRDENEVLLKIRGYCESTFEGWYARERCPGSPESPRRILALAETVWRLDYAESLPDEDVTDWTFKVLHFCFRLFDPARGPQEVPAHDKFINFFKYWFRRRLRDKKCEAAARRRRTVCFSDLAEGEPPVADRSRRGEFYAWSRRLLHKASPRLDRRMRRVIELRYLRGLGVAETSEHLGRSPKTVSNNYSLMKIVEAVRKQVNAVVLRLPPANLEGIVYYLHYEVGFGEREIAELLCVPRPTVAATLAGVCDRILSGMSRERAFELLG